MIVLISLGNISCYKLLHVAQSRQVIFTEVYLIHLLRTCHIADTGGSSCYTLQIGNFTVYFLSAILYASQVCYHLAGVKVFIIFMSTQLPVNSVHLNPVNALTGCDIVSSLCGKRKK